VAAVFGFQLTTLVQKGSKLSNEGEDRHVSTEEEVEAVRRSLAHKLRRSLGANFDQLLSGGVTDQVRRI